MTARVESLHVYPIKSCAGTRVDEFVLTAHGPEHDRDFLVINPDGRFLTQREHPRMALITPSLDAVADGKLRLSAPGMDDFAMAIGDGPLRDVTVWKWSGTGIDQGDEVAGWLSDFLGAAVRLVRFPPGVRRDTSVGGGEVRYADGYPILVTSTASLDALNASLDEPLPMNRFRPNIVVAGWPAPWTEDHTSAVTVGSDVTIEIVKPCARCVITTIDQRTAEKGREPLRTLGRTRRTEAGLVFGQNAVVRTPGVVRAGDPIS